MSTTQTQEVRKTVRNLHSFAACACGKRHGYDAVETITRTYHATKIAMPTVHSQIDGGPMEDRCDVCKRNLKWVCVKGRTTAHECNAKCRSSKSGKCECSCGGKNHGRG